MDTKLKKCNKSYVTNIFSFIIFLIMSIGIFNLYPMIKQATKDEPREPFENRQILSTIYTSNYVLYKDILNQGNSEELTGDKIFLKSNDPNEYYDEEMRDNLNNSLILWKDDLNNNFKNLDYLAYISDSPLYKTNTATDLNLIINDPDNQIIKNKYAFYIVVKYDSNGGVLINNIYGGNEFAIKNIFSDFTIRDYLGYSMSNENNIKFNNIKNATFIYGIPNDLKYDDQLNGIIDRSQNNINNEILATTTLVILCVILILGLFVPYGKGKEVFGIKGLLKLPFEVNFIIFVFGAFISGMGSYFAIYSTIEGIFYGGFNNFGISPMAINVLISSANILLWILVIYLILAGDMLLKHIFNTGFINYFKENLLILKIAKFIKKYSEDAVNYLEHIDLTDKSNKVIIKVLAINFVIMTLISMIWFFGFIASIIYSIVLFKISRKYIDNIKNKFEMLLNATNKIADGNLDVEIKDDLGLFNPYKEELEKIQVGFRKAVNEEVKSQRMKTELISNVSHDLKTPLTSIITYIDLLKNENITEEDRKSYIDTIDKKSQRLKVLIEDLFEVSKATSGDIKLNLDNIDIVELVRQIEVEFNDKISACKLNLKNNFPENKVILNLDSQKTFRIFENLFVNVIKYSMEGSRVYIDIIENMESVDISVKNMSADEITFMASDIIERFERGDKSRNTEGSGLGLAIVKSFVEAQGGTLTIEVDGDLFKVLINFKK